MDQDTQPAAGPVVDLRGRIVVVTGGGGGLGLGFATALAAQGARLVVADLHEDVAASACRRLAETGAEAVPVWGDIARAETAARIAEAARERFGRVDGLVNNAGLLSTLPLRGWTEIDVAEWDRVMAVNLRSMFLCARAVFPLMQAGGAIVNLSSGRAFEGGTGRLHYATSKAGVIGFTRALACELGPAEIRVNAVAPGYVLPDAAADALPPALAADYASGRALRRPLRLRDVTGAVLFLLSDAARFMTGQTINVDGGRIMR